VTQPGTPIEGWPQPGDPAPPQMGDRASLALYALAVATGLWLCLGLGVISMLTVASGEGFVQLFWVWAIGLVAWSIVLAWTYRRTRPS
jgi:hypothetical protein